MQFSRMIRKREFRLLAVLLLVGGPVSPGMSQPYTIDPGAMPHPHAGPAQVAPYPPGAVRKIKTADLAVTDIYPGRKPHGQFWLRITNNGPDALKNAVAKVSCFSVRTDKNNGKVSQSPASNFKVPANLAPGQTKPYATGLTLDTNVFRYYVRCEVRPVGFNDRNPSNDSYGEEVH